MIHIVKFRAERIFCTFVSCPKYPFEGHILTIKYCAWKQLYRTVHGTNWKFIYITLTITNYHASLIAKAHFKCTILFMISEKKYQEVQVFLWCILKPRACQNGTHRNCASKFLVLLAPKLLSSRIVVFIDMDTYILTECRNFEAFLKENYELPRTVVRYSLKKCQTWKFNMILIVLMDFAYIRHYWALQEIQWTPSNLSRWWI